MKKTIIGIALIAALTGCTAPSDPTPTKPPTVPSVAPTKPSDTPKPDPEPQPTEDGGGENTPKPTPQSPAPTTNEAGTPQVEFIKRWIKKYPDASEPGIMVAGLSTCKAIEKAGPGWNDNITTITIIKSVLSEAGIPGEDAIEFAQDADQNICSTDSNPT